MQKTVYVGGMMCMHCADHVEGALAKLPGVTAVCVRLEDKCAVVTMDAPVADEALAAAVRDAGYEFIRVEA